MTIEDRTTLQGPQRFSNYPYIRMHRTNSARARDLCCRCGASAPTVQRGNRCTRKFHFMAPRCFPLRPFLSRAPPSPRISVPQGLTTLRAYPRAQPYSCVFFFSLSPCAHYPRQRAKPRLTRCARETHQMYLIGLTVQTRQDMLNFSCRCESLMHS